MTYHSHGSTCIYLHAYMWFDVCIKLDVIELVLYYFLEILAGTQSKYLGWDTYIGWESEECHWPFSCECDKYFMWGPDI